MPDILPVCLQDFLYSGKSEVWEEMIEVFQQKRELVILTLFYYLVAEVRLELTTFGLWARRAANCSTPRCLTNIIIIRYSEKVKWFYTFLLYYFKKYAKYTKNSLTRKKKYSIIINCNPLSQGTQKVWNI